MVLDLEADNARLRRRIAAAADGGRHTPWVVGRGTCDVPGVGHPRRTRRARGTVPTTGSGAPRRHVNDPASTPTPQQVRRALSRAERGAALDVDEAAVLLAARGEDLERLTAVAARVRDAGLEAAGRPGVVTYSPKVFIPLTRLCRDRCHYCTFVTTPGHLERAGEGMYLSPDEVLDIARRGAELGCTEALFTLGDRPEDRWPQAREWLDEQGYDSTLDYVRAMAVRVLEETGLLPHLNPGVMSWQELNRLKPVAPSMGMMLETTSTRLFTEKGLAHHGSPDKDPAVRLRVLEDAGRLNVPFTTGILVGIGETLAERAESIFAIRKVARRYGAVQEVIVQNFRAKPETADAARRRPRARGVRRRDRRGPDRARPEDARAGAAEPGRQLRRLDRVRPAARRGRRRLGRGVAADPGPREPGAALAHPGPAARGHRGRRVRAPGAAHRAPGVRPRRRAVDRPAAVRPRRARWPARTGSPGPAYGPGPALAGARRRLRATAQGRGRTDLHPRSTPRGRTADRRDDFDEVYGDWDELRARR